MEHRWISRIKCFWAKNLEFKIPSTEVKKIFIGVKKRYIVRKRGINVQLLKYADYSTVKVLTKLYRMIMAGVQY